MTQATPTPTHLNVRVSSHRFLSLCIIAPGDARPPYLALALADEDAPVVRCAVPTCGQTLARDEAWLVCGCSYSMRGGCILQYQDAFTCSEACARALALSSPSATATTHPALGDEG